MNNVNRTFLLGFLLISFLTSCVETKYKEPQPVGKKSLSHFPKKMQGAYVNSDGDTFYVKKQFIISKSEGLLKSDKKIMTIGDSLIIKKFDKHLFVNGLNDNNHWSCFFIDYSSKNAMHVYTIDPESKSMNQLKKITSVEEFKNDNGKLDYILVNPTKSEWRRIFKEEIPELAFTFRRVSN